MNVARMLGVTGLFLGSSLLVGSPMAFADGDMGPPGGGCPSSDCGSTFTPDTDHDSDPDPPKVHEADPPEVPEADPPEVQEADPPKAFTPRVRARPQRPQPAPAFIPADNLPVPAEFVPADVPAVPPPVLTQDAAITHANVVPVSQSTPATSPQLGLIIPALVTAAAGATLVFGRPGRPAPPVTPPAPPRPPTPPPPPLTPPPFAPPAPAGGSAGPAGMGAGEDFMNPWWIITDFKGRFALGHLPTYELGYLFKGPFFTFAAGAVEMGLLGVPGWP